MRIQGRTTSNANGNPVANGYRSMILGILEESTTPLHRTEILRLLKSRYNIQPNWEAASTALHKLVKENFIEQSRKDEYWITDETSSSTPEENTATIDTPPPVDETSSLQGVINTLMSCTQMLAKIAANYNGANVRQLQIENASLKQALQTNETLVAQLRIEVKTQQQKLDEHDAARKAMASYLKGV